MAKILAGVLLFGLAAQVEVLGPVVGKPVTVYVQQDETLLDIAYDQRVGFQPLERLNPGVSVWIPDPGTPVQLPTQLILPSAPRRGVVINVPEMRLFDFTVQNGPEIFAAAIGDAVDPTPLGNFRIGRKRVDPTWYVPESIQREKPELPPVVPPGPDNPLGDRWMTIGNTTYGIHGTNNRWSIGHDSTHGCVRLYNADMHALYARLPEGTPITIVYQPVKLGRLGDGIYLEAHPDVYGRDQDPVSSTLVQLLVLGLEPYVDRAKVEQVIRDARGVPIQVGTLPTSPTGSVTSESPS